MTIEEQLRLHEDWRNLAYMDTLGKITVGCGFNLSDPPGLDDEEIAWLLARRIAQCRVDLEQFAWFNGLNDVRQRVLVDMRYNLGMPKLRGFKRMLAAVAEGDYHRAALAMRQSLWFRQTKSRGERLATWMYHGEER